MRRGREWDGVGLGWEVKIRDYVLGIESRMSEVRG